MFTPEQESFLQAFADKGIAEQADAEARNAKIEQETAISQAREAKLAELKIQAQELIDSGLREFEATAVKVSDVKAEALK